MGKSLLRLGLAIYAFFYRLTRGKVGGNLLVIRVLLLTTTGRRTGKTRTTPVGYIEHDGGYVIIGLFVVFGGANPGWFYNLRTDPHASIQVNDKQFEASAETVGPDKRGPIWTRVTELVPIYAKVAKRTKREVALVILRPTKA
jgi:deazaflavin-dependent oxidoreductase (nitroreductase family)